MINLNRNITRSLLLLAFVGVNILLIFGIGKVFNYLNTGADRSSMLHLELKKAENYTPSLEWSEKVNEGRVIDQQSLKTIEKDYLKAWYVKHVAYKNNNKTGIEDYYTESARKNIYNFIETNNQKQVSIEATTLEHHPTLEFFSEDGQLAVITDENVSEYKRIYKKGTLVNEVKETASYKVVLLLEDGFWRIRHLLKTDVSKTDAIQKSTQALQDDFKIKGINYYPQATPWDTFGEEFDLETIGEDFEIIKKAALNTIRIFIQYEDFGKAEVKAEKIEKLKKVLDLANDKGLKVIVTLFDFYGDYSVLDWTMNQKHLVKIVSTFKEHEAILAWDVKNEPDLDFDSRGKSNVLAWLNEMIENIRKIDTKHLVTVGWAKHKSVYLLKEKVDLISFHYYEDIDDFEETYVKIRTAISDKPLLLGEFGYSSYGGFWKPFSGSKNGQRKFYKKMQDMFKKNDVHFMSWTLYDFKNVPKDVVGSLPWRRSLQKRFGFIDVKGNPKPAFDYISSN